MTTSSRLTLRRTEAPRRARRAEIAPVPIVKWAGGKTQLLGELLARRPLRIRRYFEPFLGGGAMFFRLAPRRAVLSDRNDDLMNTYRCVAWKVEAVIKRLLAHGDKHCDDYYYEIRERWNDGKSLASDIDRAAAFIYMNKTCYNGLYRVNQKGLFNVPVGRYAAPRVCDPTTLRLASRVLQRAELNTGHFAEQLDEAEAGDFVYFDPPYDPVTETARFTSYTSSCFGDDDQRELAELARSLTERGVNVMLSNSDTPFIRSLYSGFDIDRVEAIRAINSKSSRRGAIGELIITNGYLS